MKNFIREYPLLSLCGLSCGLCTMHLGGYCPGCGGGDGNQPCTIAKCSREHGNVEFCCHCSEYPCGKYDAIDRYDSFISTQNLRDNLETVKNLGLPSCREVLEAKRALLNKLLEHYNAGRQKSFFANAVNLLELSDLQSVLSILEQHTAGLSLKERAAQAVSMLQTAASARNIDLKLRKKPLKERI